LDTSISAGSSPVTPVPAFPACTATLKIPRWHSAQTSQYPLYLASLWPSWPCLRYGRLHTTLLEASDLNIPALIASSSRHDSQCISSCSTTPRSIGVRLPPSLLWPLCLSDVELVKKGVFDMRRVSAQGQSRHWAHITLLGPTTTASNNINMKHRAVKGYQHQREQIKAVRVYVNGNWSLLWSKCS